MGNAFSADAAVYKCDKCEKCFTRRYQLQVHKAHQCAVVQADRRRKHTPTSVTLTAPPTCADHSSHHHHHHPDDDCSGCEGHEEQWDDEELRLAVESQVQAFMEATGEEWAPETLAELSDLLLGVVTNGKCQLQTRPASLGGLNTQLSVTKVLETAQYCCRAPLHLYMRLPAPNSSSSGS